MFCFSNTNTNTDANANTNTKVLMRSLRDQSLDFDSKYKIVAPANLCVEWGDAIHSRICPTRRLSSKLCFGQEEAKVG